MTNKTNQTNEQQKNKEKLKSRILECYEELDDKEDAVEEVFDKICPVGYKDNELKNRLGFNSDEILDLVIEVLK